MSVARQGVLLTGRVWRPVRLVLQEHILILKGRFPVQSARQVVSVNPAVKQLVNYALLGGLQTHLVQCRARNVNKAHSVIAWAEILASHVHPALMLTKRDRKIAHYALQDNTKIRQD